jgi:hypothetical protein
MKTDEDVLRADRFSLLNARRFYRFSVAKSFTSTTTSWAFLSMAQNTGCALVSDCIY